MPPKPPRGPKSAKEHFSGVAPGEEFQLTADGFDARIFTSETVELDENDAGTRGRVASSRAVATEVECLLCGRTFATAFMRQHIGAHLLEADWGAHGKARPQFPCGSCGVQATA
jgi:hypothetical protein